MISEWQKSTINDVCILVTDGSHFSPASVNNGYYMASVKDFTTYGFNFTSCRQISEDDYLKLVESGCAPEYNDILIGKDGARYLEDVILYRQKEKLVLLSSIAILRSNTMKIIPEFLYYILSDKKFNNNIKKNYGSGSAIPRIVLKDIKRVPIIYPNLKTQNAIVNVLGSIDKKIELNNKINNNLSQMAKAIFKSWFVDFDPFQNGEFVESELGLIPKLWHVAKLGDITTEIRDKVKSQNLKVFSAVKTGDLQLSEEYFTKQVFSIDIGKYIIVKPKQFAYNPARVNIGSIGMNDFEFSGCVSPVYVVFKTEPQYHHFFNLYIKTMPFKQEVISRASGSVRQSMNYRDFSLIKIVYPPLSVVNTFNTIYESLLKNIEFNTLKNEKLVSIRDALLPKLMSGEIDVFE